MLFSSDDLCSSKHCCHCDGLHRVSIRYTWGTLYVRGCMIGHLFVLLARAYARLVTDVPPMWAESIQAVFVLSSLNPSQAPVIQKWLFDLYSSAVHAFSSHHSTYTPPRSLK